MAFLRSSVGQLGCAFVVVVGLISFAMARPAAALENPLPSSKSEPAATQTGANVISGTALDKPNMGDDALIAWATNAATQAMNFDSANHQDVFDKAKKNFTPDGWKAFRDLYLTPEHLKFLTERKPIVSSTPVKPAVLRTAELSAGTYRWSVDIVLKTTTRAGSTRVMAEDHIRLIVVRVPKEKNPAGILITEWIRLPPNGRSDEEGNASACKPDKVPEFPLPPLITRERETRLRFFLKDAPLTLVEHAIDVDKKTCDALLQNLKSFDSVTVLEPSSVSHKREPRVAEQISSDCPTLDLDSEYYADRPAQPPAVSAPWWRQKNIYNRDPAFLAKPKKEKEALSRNHITATANFEYYDLSPYLGPGLWGYFAEGGVMYATAEERNGQVADIDPPRAHFCNPSNFATIQKIVDVRSCTEAADLFRPDNRISHIVYIPGLWGDYPKSNVYAFIDIAGRLYRINVDFTHALFDLAALMLPERRVFNLFIDSIEKTGSDTAFKYICGFSTFAQPYAGIGSQRSVPPGITIYGETP